MRNKVLYIFTYLLKLIEKITNLKTNYIHYAIKYYLKKKSPLILEIGTHNGEDTIKFSKWYPKGTIHTFEPDPRLTDYLCKKFKNKKNIIFHPNAIYKENKPIKFNLSKAENLNDFKGSGSSSLISYKRESKKFFDKVVEIQAIKLSQVKQLANTIIDLIWIDVQGAERLIIESHEHIFNKSKIIWIEYGEADYKDFYTRSEIINKFKQTHSVSFFSNRNVKGNLLLVKI
jgi:2-O-methyltransferase